MCHWPGSLGKVFSVCLQNCLGSTLSPQTFLPIKEKSLLLVTSPVKISLIVSWCSRLCIFVSKDTFLGDVMKSPKTQRGCVGLGKTLCWGLICGCQKEKKGSRHLGEMSSLQDIWFSNCGGGDKKHMEVRGGVRVPGGLEAEGESGAGSVQASHRLRKEITAWLSFQGSNRDQGRDSVGSETT